MVSVYNVQ